jgi:hypothetical protein
MNNLVVNGLITRTTDCAGNELEILNADLAFGLPKEDPVLDKLRKHFEEEIAKSTYQYCPHDGFSKTTEYEIKSRRNRYNQYPTTIIPCSKVRNMKRDRLVFVFNFTDGLYYIEYDKEKFAKYEIKMVEAVRKRSGVVGKTLEPHFFIPIGELTHINI